MSIGFLIGGKKVMKIKCKICNGSGIVGIGDGIRGVKKCSECNGKGYINFHSEYKEKSLYVVKFNNNKYYDGTGNTTNKLKNAKIYSSEKYANQAGNKMIKKSSKLTDYNLVEIEIKEIE